MGSSRKNRIYSRKALAVVKEIKEKYPSGISNFVELPEEDKSWLGMKLKQFSILVKKIRFPVEPSWFGLLNRSQGKGEEFFSRLKEIETDLKSAVKNFRQESKKKRLFESIGCPACGSLEERRQLVDAIESRMEVSDKNEPEIPFPQNTLSKAAADALQDILSDGTRKSFIGNHEGLSQNIQTDLLDWLGNLSDSMDEAYPFEKEEDAFDRIKKMSIDDLSKDLAETDSQVEATYKKFVPDSGNVDFEFYRTMFRQIYSLENPEECRKSMEILYRNFIKDLEEDFIERKLAWEQNFIDEKRKKFLKELYKKIENFIKLSKVVSPFLNDFGRLWDLSEGNFETSGFELLNTFAELLDKDESLQELAELMGRQEQVQKEFEKELREKHVVKSKWLPEKSVRGEKIGLRYSNDIASVVPTELAIMVNPATKKLFQLKFAQKELLSYEYQEMERYSYDETEKEEVLVGKESESKKGPVIICVDTSGSMHGTPENIAKTITYALTKIALEEKRNCYLISFSTGIEVLDLSYNKSGNMLSSLISFLKMSFNGGTDASPALKHVLEKLKMKAWRNADVLMISDFVMGSLGTYLEQQINYQKATGTCFHSLVIGSSENANVLSCFDHNWFYNMNDPARNRRLVENLRTIKKN